MVTVILITRILWRWNKRYVKASYLLPGDNWSSIKMSLLPQSIIQSIYPFTISSKSFLMKRSPRRIWWSLTLLFPPCCLFHKSLVPAESIHQLLGPLSLLQSQCHWVIFLGFVCSWWIEWNPERNFKYRYVFSGFSFFVHTPPIFSFGISIGLEGRRKCPFDELPSNC